MKKSAWTLTEDFSIQDERGIEVYHVQGSFMSPRGRMAMLNSSGNEVAAIQRKLLAWGPTYEIYHADKLAAVVKEKLFTFLGHQFYVESPGNDDLHAQGNFTNHEYVITRAEREVARISKAWFSWTDTFGVDVADGEDAALILATTVVIERCNEQRAASHTNITMNPTP